MNTLRIPTMSITPEGIAVHVVVPGHVLRPEGAGDLGLGEVTLEGVLSQVSDEYMFRGVISGTYEQPCDRCLDPATVPFREEVTWLFAEGAYAPEADEDVEFTEEELEDEEDNWTHVFSGNELDLRQAAWEEIVLALPHKLLCKAECKGLCPQCGTNLNREVCACVPEPEEAGAPPPSDKGFAKLREMFPKLGKEEVEE